MYKDYVKVTALLLNICITALHLYIVLIVMQTCRNFKKMYYTKVSFAVTIPCNLQNRHLEYYRIVGHYNSLIAFKTLFGPLGTKQTKYHGHKALDL